MQVNPFLIQEFAAGEVILREGQANECLYAINSGRVEVSKGTESTKTVLGVLEVGDLFGEMGLIDGQPSSATVTALEPTIVWLYDDVAFREAIEKDPQLAKSIVDMLVKRLRNTTNQLQRLADAGGPAQQQVSEILDQHRLV